MKKIIGEVGVDSGQILVCDPGYIDSEWENEDFNDNRRYLHNESKRILVFNRDFLRYDKPIIPYGKSMNEMIEANEVTERPASPPLNQFSYNACCTKTLSHDETYDGQLNYKMGHPGVGVVTRSGYGDGVYPVIADIDDKTGRVRSITINFMEDEDEIFDDTEERRDFGNDEDE